MLSSVARYWDSAAGTFDDEPDHGLRDARVRAAWRDRLAQWFPAPPSSVLDLGCGTGSLGVLAEEMGHEVVGVDVSAAMVDRARKKVRAAGAGMELLVGDAGDPPVGDRSFDVVLARHLLWTLPTPEAALRRWVRLLRPGGRLVLVEGRWDAPAGAAGYVDEAAELPWGHGIPADVLTANAAQLVTDVRFEDLTDPGLWGHEVTDERYAVVACR